MTDVEAARPRATYRLQLHPGFPFAAAEQVLDYLRDLGVSHVYTSPCFQAPPESTHGYDVVDPRRVRAELGGAEGHRRFVERTRALGLGRVVDIVPNHMAVTAANSWWWDVLENGPASHFATWFDVDWEAESRRDERILLPILGERYGAALAQPTVRLVREEEGFRVRYHDQAFPVAPRSLDMVLRRAAARIDSEELGFLADAFAGLPPASATDRASTARRHRDKRVLGELLAKLLLDNSAVAGAIDATVEEVNGDPELLDALLERQNYRLSHWRAAGSDLGYRRFFDINSLVGVRVEEAAVFADTHALVRTWVAEGIADGLRVDHPDGLRDPEAYLTRLRRMAPRAWIVVEKILQPDERLRESWPVEGTTGYEFLNLAGGLFIDPAAEEPLTRLYDEFTGRAQTYAEVVRDARRMVSRELLGSDVNRLTELLLRACERHRDYRDATRAELRAAVLALAAVFPVYRTYVRLTEGGPVVHPDDVAILDRALAAAAEHDPEIDPALLGFLGDLLRLRYTDGPEAEFCFRFQQFTGPVAAKGVEDTALYAYVRLLALNDVGGEPDRFGTPADVFHRRMQEAARRSPAAMLATSTHDTKRSEDVRCRLAVLSEVPERWSAALSRWSGRNEHLKRGDAPDRVTEYLIYQTLVGAWPIEVDRLAPYVEKAIREAKRHTSWLRPDAEYEAATRAFVEGLLADDSFRDEVEAFVETVRRAGRINSLALTLLKLTAPGVPDLYQGTELWALDLVDPDNRRPVDFDRRRRLLAELAHLDVEEVWRRLDEGLPKLWTIQRALRLRAERPGPFDSGDYRPLSVRGMRAAHVVAYARGGEVVTVVPRLTVAAGNEWTDTEVEVPAGRFTDVLSGSWRGGGWTSLAELLRRFPVALLAREDA